MAFRVIEALRRRLGAVLRDRRGATAIMFAFMIVPIFASVGLAVDSSLGYLLKSRMSKSLDTAGLAAGRMALDAKAEDIAWSYFSANFHTSPGGAVDRANFRFDLSEDRRFVTLSAVGETPTLFMRVFGRDKMTVSARTRIRRETTGMEIALVLDNTGSMWGSKYTALRASAFDLISILYGTETEMENLWVSLVPYTATVNIGNTRTSWLRTDDRVRNASTSDDFPAASPWRGCVMARATPSDTGDTPPTGNSTRFTSYYYAATTRTQDNNWPPMVTSIADQNLGVEANRNTARSPNLGCASPIVPLTKSRATIEAGLAAMGPIHRGGTTGNLGLSWGWRAISPSWRGLWGGETPSDMPLDYGTPFMDKVVVILTDGENQFHDQDTGSGTPASDFTAYGRIEALVGATGTDDQKRTAGRVILDNRMTGTCAAMKAEGIRIYTIVFGLTPGTAAHTRISALYRGCASNPAMYYDAVTNAQLRDAFRSIGGELANLRIVE